LQNFAGPAGLIVQRLTYTIRDGSLLADLVTQIEIWESILIKRLVVLQMAEMRNTGPAAAEESVLSKRSTSQSIVSVLQPDLGKSYSLQVMEDRYPITDQELIQTSDRLTDLSVIFRSNSEPDILIEHCKCSSSPQPDIDVPHLASRLYVANPNVMHILPCEGYFLRENTSEKRYELYFRIPSFLGSMTPKTLRHVLMHPESQGKYGPSLDLNQRLRLAKELAAAVLYVHSGGIVHKSIRPDTVLVFLKHEKQDKYGSFPYSIGPSFLAGFDMFRSEKARDDSARTEDAAPVKTLYRHPDRWSSADVAAFTMRHDIYSLGVLLIEVGFWQSLVEELGDESHAPHFLSGLHSLMVARNASRVRSWLLRLAQVSLPRAMGREYSQVVLSCLTGVESWLPNTIQAGPGSQIDTPNIASAYLEAVIERLERIRL
jgi:serine/threonine protein kinase